jgi:hypothetical protein
MKKGVFVPERILNTFHLSSLEKLIWMQVSFKAGSGYFYKTELMKYLIAYNTDIKDDDIALAFNVLVDKTYFEYDRYYCKFRIKKENPFPLENF